MGLIGYILVKLGLDNSEYKKGLDNSKQQTNQFSSTIKKLGGMMAAAFSVTMLLQFGREISNLAARAGGVKKAFEKIADDGLLQKLRDSTSGMVTDFDLMKNSVKANNFKIPLTQLATYFQFATQRAAETGESVDYLVDSIITGLGRQSVMILDNLGLSAAEIRSEMDKGKTMAEAVGVIIAKSMGNSADVIDKTSYEVANLNTEWGNFKVTLGDSLNKFLTPILSTINDMVDGVKKLNSEMDNGEAPKSLWERIKNQFNPFYSGAREFTGKKMSIYNKNTDELISSIKDVASANKILQEINDGFYSSLDLNINKVKKEAKDFIDAQSKKKEAIKSEANSIESLLIKIDELSILRDRETDAKKRAAYNQQINSLNKQVELYQQQGVVINGLIPTHEARIAKLQEEAKWIKDPTKLRSINDEIAAEQRKLEILKMTAAEYANFNQYRTTPLPAVKSNIQGSATSVPTDPIKQAQQAAAALAEANKDAVDEFGFTLKDWEDMGKQLNGIIQNTFISAFESLGTALGDLKNADASAILSALISPFADFAISLGTIILTSGTAIENLKLALVSFFGGSAVLAGAALIAVGVAAKAGIAALAKGGSSGSTTSSTTYSGGNSYSPSNMLQPKTVQIVGKLQGRDIYLSSMEYQKYTKK